MNKVIIFDFFGVVCSEVAPRWIGDHLPLENEKELHETLIREVDEGKGSANAMYEALGKKAGMSGEEVLRGWQAYIEINHELAAYIRELKESHRVALCSNAWSDFINPILDQHALRDLFEVITISSEVGCTKPDPAMYLDTVTKLGVMPTDCVFIDDNQKNVIGAEAVGMKGVKFASVAELKKTLS